MNQHYPFCLPPLPYGYAGLEPFLDQSTLHFHHDCHWKTYVERLNEALEPYPQYHTMTLPELLTQAPSMPEPLQTALRNHGGGAYNHGIYFLLMNRPNRGSQPTGQLQQEIDRWFGSFEQWKQQMKDAAVSQFGSGYAWLVWEQDRLRILKTSNQDTPDLLTQFPVMNVDVWEHAYYLCYQNRRPEYVENWFCLIDWKRISQRFQERMENSGADFI